MNNNIENTAVQTKTFTLPENDEFSAEDLADDYAGLQLSFRRVKIPPSVKRFLVGRLRV